MRPMARKQRVGHRKEKTPTKTNKDKKKNMHDASWCVVQECVGLFFCVFMCMCVCAALLSLYPCNGGCAWLRGMSDVHGALAHEYGMGAQFFSLFPTRLPPSSFTPILLHCRWKDEAGVERCVLTTLGVNAPVLDGAVVGSRLDDEGQHETDDSDDEDDGGGEDASVSLLVYGEYSRSVSVSASVSCSVSLASALQCSGLSSSVCIWWLAQHCSIRSTFVAMLASMLSGISKMRSGQHTVKHT